MLYHTTKDNHRAYLHDFSKPSQQGVKPPSQRSSDISYCYHTKFCQQFEGDLGHAIQTRIVSADHKWIT